MCNYFSESCSLRLSQFVCSKILIWHIWSNSSVVPRRNELKRKHGLLLITNVDRNTKWKWSETFPFGTPKDFYLKKKWKLISKLWISYVILLVLLLWRFYLYTVDMWMSQPSYKMCVSISLNFEFFFQSSTDRSRQMCGDVLFKLNRHTVIAHARTHVCTVCLWIQVHNYVNGMTREIFLSFFCWVNLCEHNGRGKQKKTGMKQ